jgi:hypothetical protein
VATSASIASTSTVSGCSMMFRLRPSKFWRSWPGRRPSHGSHSSQMRDEKKFHCPKSRTICADSCGRRKTRKSLSRVRASRSDCSAASSRRATGLSTDSKMIRDSCAGSNGHAITCKRGRRIKLEKILKRNNRARASRRYAPALESKFLCEFARAQHPGRQFSDVVRAAGVLSSPASKQLQAAKHLAGNLKFSQRGFFAWVFRIVG